MVLNIIGKDSAGVKGRVVPDSGVGNPAEAGFLAKSILASGKHLCRPCRQDNARRFRLVIVTAVHAGIAAGRPQLRSEHPARREEAS